MTNELLKAMQQVIPLNVGDKIRVIPARVYSLEYPKGLLKEGLEGEITDILISEPRVRFKVGDKHYQLYLDQIEQVYH